MFGLIKLLEMNLKLTQNDQGLEKKDIMGQVKVKSKWPIFGKKCYARFAYLHSILFMRFQFKSVKVYYKTLACFQIMVSILISYYSTAT